MTLIVMAAGMGSRYGGLKQLDPVGPNGEFILDYTVYDAVRAGFDKIVFVIKKENHDLFAETVGNRIGKNVDVKYCYQSIDDLPNGFSVPQGRIKQWGTAHAVLAARSVVNECFAAVNADDFYGFESFKGIADYMKQNTAHPCCMSGFVLKNTLTENGSVSRGECSINGNGMLTDITERTKIMRLSDGTTAYYENDEWKPISENAIVSMNCWGLPAEFMKYAFEGFKRFLQCGGDVLKKEYYLPDAVKNYLFESNNSAKVLKTAGQWYGVTYHEDRAAVVAHIRKVIDAGLYPEDLWN